MDLDQFIAMVKKSTQQSVFFHFTDQRNLPLIRQHGLLSTRELRRRGIEVPAMGGNEWSRDADQRCGMDAYVHLCFKTGHPMEYLARQDGRIEGIFHICIRPEVIKLPDVMITDDVSNKAGIVPQLAGIMLDKLDLDVLYKWTDWKDKAVLERLRAAEKCELLIPTQLPLEHITNL